MDQTTEEHGLRPGRYESKFFENHILARTLLVVEIVSRIGIVFPQIIFINLCSRQLFQVDAGKQWNLLCFKN